jgi:hypothetical protein
VRSPLRPPIKPTVKRPEAVEDGTDRRRSPDAKAEKVEEKAAPAWLPQIPKIRWEWKLGGIVLEAWYNPKGLRGRSNSTYLGRIGKKRMKVFDAMEPDAAAALVKDSVTKWQMEKGLLS